MILTNHAYNQLVKQLLTVVLEGALRIIFRQAIIQRSNETSNTHPFL